MALLQSQWRVWWPSINNEGELGGPPAITKVIVVALMQSRRRAWCPSNNHEGEFDVPPAMATPSKHTSCVKTWLRIG